VEDAVSGQNFEHRKVWVFERLEFLAGVFFLAVAVLSFGC
jgi:hypothetical protein